MQNFIPDPFPRRFWHLADFAHLCSAETRLRVRDYRIAVHLRMNAEPDAQPEFSQPCDGNGAALQSGGWGDHRSTHGALLGHELDGHRPGGTCAPQRQKLAQR